MSQICAIDDQRGGLLDELTIGFEALLQKAEELTETNSHLLECVKHFQEDHQRLTPVKSLSVNSELPDLANLKAEARYEWKRDARINKGIQACKLLRIATMPAVPLRRNTSGSLEEQRENQIVGKEVGCSTTVAASCTEEDFTTPGPKGDLGCPFSRSATVDGPVNGIIGLADGAKASLHPPDPITAEFHDAKPEKAPSVAASASKCPIRYMDQHSPEEVAEYFENHKHEIPRSHEVCVKRYQANEASIRSLDVKYGSLVKMIQGLGKMHKPMLPEKDGNEVVADDADSAETESKAKIEEWAQDLPNGRPPPTTELTSREESEAHDDHFERTGHFERPLREVRLGESPSRPWGIQVPYSEHLALSTDAEGAGKGAASSGVAHLPDVPIHEGSAPNAASKCPFHKLMPQPASEAPTAENTALVVDPPQEEAQVREKLASHRKQDTKYPQIVFNGPVFFGYPADSVATLMKSLQGE